MYRKTRKDGEDFISTDLQNRIEKLEKESQEQKEIIKTQDAKLERAKEVIQAQQQRGRNRYEEDIDDSYGETVWDEIADWLPGPIGTVAKAVVGVGKKVWGWIKSWFD